MNIKKIKVNYFIFILLMYLLIFQNAVQNKIEIFKYLDEVIALSIVPISMIKLSIGYKNIKIKKNDLIIFLSLLGIVIVGIYSSCIYRFQTVKFVLSDMLVFLKFFMVYFLSMILWKENFFEENRKKILKHLKLIIIALFLLTISNYIFDLYPGEYRFGIKSNTLFYGLPTYLGAVCAFLLALFIICSEKVISIYSIFTILIMLSTLRFKSIGCVIAVIVVAIMIDKSNKKISFSKLAFVAIIVCTVAYNQIEYYFFETDGSARMELSIKSLEIAKDYFPIGTGFGTYGSFFSVESYSPVYYIYKLNNIYGLEKGRAGFVLDTFWPMIIGQFGISGFILYVICLVYILKNIQQGFNKDNKYIYIGKIVSIIYLLISSTSESAFVNSIAIPFAIILGIKYKNIGEKIK